MVKVSLRLWSDNVALQSIMDDVGLQTHYLHVKGDFVPRRILKSGVPARWPLEGKVAKRHYASSHSVDAATHQEMLDAVQKILTGVEGSQKFIVECKAGRIEATLWVAEVGHGPRVELNVPDSCLRSAEALGIELFVESFLS